MMGDCFFCDKITIDSLQLAGTTPVEVRPLQLPPEGLVASCRLLPTVLPLPYHKVQWTTIGCPRGQIIRLGQA